MTSTPPPSPDTASLEADRIAAQIASPFQPNALIITAGSNAYLGRYSWAADKHQKLSEFALLIQSRILDHSDDWTDAVWMPGHLCRFVDASDSRNASRPRRYVAFLVFVRVPGCNERIVVVKAEP